MIQIIFTLCIMPISLFINANVVVSFWQWFVIPIFNVPSLGIMAAMGVLYFVRFMCISPKSEGAEKEIKFGSIINTAIAYPLITWGMGWIIMKFM